MDMVMRSFPNLTAFSIVVSGAMGSFRAGAVFTTRVAMSCLRACGGKGREKRRKPEGRRRAFRLWT